MLMYFILFTFIGFIIGNILLEKEKAFVGIIIVSIIWAFTYSIFWGLVSFGELTLGYFVAKIIRERN